MRHIAISTDVFAAIWQQRRDGEDTEEAILRRLLGLPAEPKVKTRENSPQGFLDDRSGTFFPQGMVIFRKYKGKDIRARAVNGFWLHEISQRKFSSLNRLSQHFVDANENAWVNWKYEDPETREVKLIDEFRKAQRGGHE